MSLPNRIQELLDLAGPAGSRPFDRLQRGKPLAKGRETVEKLAPEILGPKGNPDRLLFLQSALYIYFDCFEEAHRIAQDHEGLLGNWLHAVLHRREPDAGNSKYWYHRVKAPAGVLQGIGQETLGILREKDVPELGSLAKALEKSGHWEPEAFVDLASKYLEKDPASPAYRALALVQEAEWRGLTGYILSE